MFVISWKDPQKKKSCDKGRGLDPLKLYRYINGNELHKRINCHKLIYLGVGIFIHYIDQNRTTAIIENQNYNQTNNK